MTGMDRKQGSVGSSSEHDARIGYCRRLGHHLPFAYCRDTGGDGPCPKILDCWYECFDVRSFLERHQPEALAAASSAPPAPKVATLVDGPSEPGSRSVVWSGSSLPAGVYFVRLRSKDRISVVRATRMH